MDHKCNAWCFMGTHALLFDSELTDRSVIERIGQQLAAREGYRFAGVSHVQPPGQPAPGTRTADGIVRGRMVIWASA